jgi:hypothetical protein
MLYSISVSVCVVAYGWYALHTGDSWYLSGWKLVCLYWIQCNELICAVLYLDCDLLWILQNRRSVAVWLLGVGMWYWKHRVSGYVLGGRRLVVWRVPQSRRWCSLWESWDHYLLRSCRIHSGTLWFHISPPIWIVESVWVVCCMCWCLVLCWDAVIAILLYWVAIDINVRRNVNMLGVAGMGQSGSRRVEGTYLPL